MSSRTNSVGYVCRVRRDLLRHEWVNMHCAEDFSRAPIAQPETIAVRNDMFKFCKYYLTIYESNVLRPILY